MKIEYRTGNLLTAEDIKIVIQGCNSHGVMGSGIAKTIRDLYPQNYEIYRKAYVDQGNLLYMGQVVWADMGRHLIGNLISQKDYGRDPNVVYVGYSAIQAGVETIDAFVAQRRSLTDQEAEMELVGFPLIGAGLANGSWKKISQIIEDGASNFQPIVYLFDGVMPTS